MKKEMERGSPEDDHRPTQHLEDGDGDVNQTKGHHRRRDQIEHAGQHDDERRRLFFLFLRLKRKGERRGERKERKEKKREKKRRKGKERKEKRENKIRQLNFIGELKWWRVASYSPLRRKG